MSKENLGPTSPLGPNERARIKARRQLRNATDEYCGKQNFPDRDIGFDELHLIDKQAIIAAGVGIVVMMNLSSGSSDGFKLYELLVAYFHNVEFRAQANGLLEQLRSPVLRNETG